MIAPIPKLSEKEWNGLRRTALLDFLKGFLTVRNLVAYRGGYHRDVLGFGWAALYQTLRVSSVVVTTHRNEGHLRAGERIFGTGEFAEIFRMPRDARFLHDMIRVVNLRHHVAGVVLPKGEIVLNEGKSGAEVLPGYEADYAYISASFVQNLMRGYEVCGLKRGSRTWNRIGENLSTILYQSAGATGLCRAPRDFRAHEEFCNAYDRQFESHPPSERVAGMARDIARRILPITAALTGIPVEEHLDRHIDPVSRRWLFPDRSVLKDLKPVHSEWLEMRHEKNKNKKEAERQKHREDLWMRPDVAALWEAYGKTPPSSTDSRLMGAILLHAIDDPASSYRVETLDLAPENPLLRQGEVSGSMVVILHSSEPLVVTCSDEEDGKCREEVIDEFTGPAIVGDLGMWGNRPELATTGVCRPAKLKVILISRDQFSSLNAQPGFRVAVAADTQRDIQLGVKGILHLLAMHPEMETDAAYRSLVLLLSHLCGGEEIDLGRIEGFPKQATLQESIEFLRPLVADVKLRLGQRSHLAPLINTVLESIR